MTQNTKTSPKRRFAREPNKPADAVTKAPATNEVARARETKIGKVIALLERTEDATLAEMVEATGWLPHTTRAALTGLKKKEHTITKDRRDDVTCYRIAKAPATTRSNSASRAASACLASPRLVVCNDATSTDLPPKTYWTSFGTARLK